MLPQPVLRLPRDDRHWQHWCARARSPGLPPAAGVCVSALPPLTPLPPDPALSLPPPLATAACVPGLNEVALGIAVPKYWARLMARVVGQGPAERLLQFAVMLTPEEARRAGLVDEVVPVFKLLAAAEGAMQEMLKSPDFSRAVRRAACAGACLRAAAPGAHPREHPPTTHATRAPQPPTHRGVQETKRLLRQEFADEWAAFASGEADYAWDLLSSPPVVKRLGAVMQRLQGNKAGGKAGGGGSGGGGSAPSPQSKL